MEPELRLNPVDYAMFAYTSMNQEPMVAAHLGGPRILAPIDHPADIKALKRWLVFLVYRIGSEGPFWDLSPEYKRGVFH